MASARQIRRLIADLNDAGTTIFLTTHYIEEAERLCNRIAFIVSGRIVDINTVENLMKGIQDRQVVRFEVSGDVSSLVGYLSEQFTHLAIEAESGNRIRVESEEEILIGPLVRFFEDAETDVYEARKVKPSLEDVFVKITGIEAGEMKQEKAKRRGNS